jgi:hypothetical protein
MSTIPGNVNFNGNGEHTPKQHMLSVLDDALSLFDTAPKRSKSPVHSRRNRDYDNDLPSN